MRVLLDMSYAARGPSGTGVYLTELVRALRSRSGVDIVEASQRRRLRPGRSGRRRNPLRSAANALLDLAWRHVGLPRAARLARADVLHHPLPARSIRASCAQAVTVHDVAFERLPERFDPVWRGLARRGHRAAVRHADAVICVSEATRSDAVALLGARPERTVVAPHGPGQELPPRQRADPRHFLYVGDAEPRKNVAGLLAAYAAYRSVRDRPLELVLAGSAASAARGAGVRGEHRPDGERLAALLAGAMALVHPSLHEGFGLTLLEAMTAEVPVVAVRNAATREVCGDAALLVDEHGLADALGEIHADAGLRERLAARGRERAAGFSWAGSAERHEEGYTLAVATHAGTGK